MLVESLGAGESDIYTMKLESEIFKIKSKCNELQTITNDYLQPNSMETAPRDGSPIIVLTDACWGGCAVVSWDDTWDTEYGGWWMLDDGKCAYEIPLRGGVPAGWIKIPVGVNNE